MFWIAGRPFMTSTNISVYVLNDSGTNKNFWCTNQHKRLTLILSDFIKVGRLIDLLNFKL